MAPGGAVYLVLPVEKLDGSVRVATTLVAEGSPVASCTVVAALVAAKNLTSMLSSA